MGPKRESSTIVLLSEHSIKAIPNDCCTHRSVYCLTFNEEALLLVDDN